MKCAFTLIRGWHGPSGRRGATAVEFATVGALFTALLMFTLWLGFRLYVQVALDYAAGRAARMLSTDTTHSLSHDPTSFQTATLCPLLNPFLACSGVSFGLWPVTDYLNGSAAPGGNQQAFTAGQGGSLMLLQLTYAVPDFAWPAPDGSGTGTMTGVAVTARFPFQNEY